MDIRVLRYVLAVAEQSNFTAAARALNVSQPALSQQIRALEDELQVCLFTRTSQGAALTNAGALVVDHARRVVGTAATLRDEVEAFRGVRRGQLRVGVTQSFNALHLAPILAAFLLRHDAIDVTVRELANGRIIEGVAAGLLDLGIAFGPPGETVVSRRLYEDRLMLACSPEHLLASRSSVPLECLSSEMLALLTEDFATRREVDGFLSAHGIRPRRIVSLNRFSTIIGLVATGCCVSVVPTWPDVSSGPTAVRFLPLTPAPAPRTTNVVLPIGNAAAPSAQKFSELLGKLLQTEGEAATSAPQGPP